MTKFRNYLPETIFFDRKNGTPSRVFHEQCAFFRASDGFPVVASRGAMFPLGAAFGDLFPELPDPLCLLSGAAAKKPAPVPETRDAESGTLLLFPDFLPSTGLIFLVRLPDRVRDICRVAGEKLSPPPLPLPENRCAGAEKLTSLYERLSEIFFYTERVMCEYQGFLSRVLTAARFVGCRISSENLSGLPATLAETDETRLTVFLLCTFLALRRLTGNVNAETEDGGGQFVLRLSLTPPTDLPAKRTEPLPDRLFDFLSLPAFRDFEIQVCKNGIFLRAALPKAAAFRSAAGGAEGSVYLFFGTDSAIFC